MVYNTQCIWMFLANCVKGIIVLLSLQSTMCRKKLQIFDMFLSAAFNGAVMVLVYVSLAMDVFREAGRHCFQLS